MTCTDKEAGLGATGRAAATYPLDHGPNPQALDGEHGRGEKHHEADQVEQWNRQQQDAHHQSEAENPGAGAQSLSGRQDRNRGGGASWARPVDGPHLDGDG
jgi:hypothetical protein